MPKRNLPILAETSIERAIRDAARWGAREIAGGWNHIRVSRETLRRCAEAMNAGGRVSRVAEAIVVHCRAEAASDRRRANGVCVRADALNGLLAVTGEAALRRAAQTGSKLGFTEAFAGEAEWSE